MNSISNNASHLTDFMALWYIVELDDERDLMGAKKVKISVSDD